MSKCIVVLVACVLCAGVVFAADIAPGVKQPNFVIIYGEAHGWANSSVQMDDAIPKSRNDFYHTPNLERLAKEGMRFANGYAASPRCTPSRAALMTGKTPALLHMTYIGEGKKDMVADNGLKMIPPKCVLELSEDEITIPMMLLNQGYATAHFGKWHLGRVNPSKHGFTENDGPNNNGGPENVNSPNPKEAFGNAEKGMAFMTKQAAAKKPFFLQISQYAARGPEGARKETLAVYMKKAGLTEDSAANLKHLSVAEAAVLDDMDVTIGMLLKKIDDLGLAGTTYVFYSADHGGQGRNQNAPLTSGKGNLWEGGLRVPFLMRGPGVKAGACSHARVAHFDLLPTIAELAHLPGPLPKGIEGGSFASILATGTGDVKRSRPEMYFHFPHYDHENDGPATVMISGDLKLFKVYETGAVRMFDLSKDYSEKHDLAQEQASKAAELEKKMDAYLKEINAQMATKNPDYDPNKAPEPKKGKKGGK
ncbi:MAG: sulfatase [Planctomycetota bacterium]